MADAQEQQREIRIVSESRHLKTQPFIPPEDQNLIGKVWEDWIEGIEREFRYFKITEIQDKIDALIIYGGKEIARLEKSLPNPPEDRLDDYLKLRTKLDEYFLPKKNIQHGRYGFLKMKPNPEETITVYASRLREKALECDFPNTDERILEHIIQTIDNQHLIQKSISKNWDLTRFLTEASQHEDISLQLKDMKIKTEEDEKVARIQKNEKYSTNDDSFKCQYCGMTGKHRAGENCPAYGMRCFKCKRWNHYSSVCTDDSSRFRPSKARNRTFHRNKDYRQQTHSNRRYIHDRQRDERRYYLKRDNSRYGRSKSRSVRMATETERRGTSSSDDEFVRKDREHYNIRRIETRDSQKKSVDVEMSGLEIMMDPDSGADVNIMDEYQFRALVHRAPIEPILEKSETTLRTLQTELSVKGEFQTTIRNETRGVKTRVIVINGRMKSLPLLSRQTMIALGMLEIREDGSLLPENELKRHEKVIKNIEVNREEKIEEILKRHSEVFNGIGKIRDIKNNKDMFAKFNMIPGTAPIAQKPRPVAFYLKEPLKKWMDICIEEEIFEKVPPGEPVTWCSPLVVQPKPRFHDIDKDELEPHMIRASVDLRVPNKYMERNRVTQGPIVEDFTHKFNDCCIFSKLDMRQGYHQLLLDPESRSVATFSTPWGNYRPKRLIFGAKSSQDLFDETIYRIFGDIPKCLNQRDDILLGGRNIEEHNSTLEMVLKRAADFGITFNREKCQFGVEELEFYGYKFTKDGLKPAPEKVKAVKDSRAPESKEAVRSFLGMIGYLSKFIPRYSSLTATLRHLTHKNTKFKWGNEEDEAFQKLKNSITNEDTMAYFDPRRKIIVRTEASYNEGLSAGLFQETNKGLQPVHFISRTMTPTERRYSQTEKDALAIRWMKQRFGIYLLGAPKFKIITSHKPLISMFNKPTIKLVPRIEKWVMEMQDVDFELVYQPGKDELDPLDFLSRHPLPIVGSDSTEKMIKQIILDKYAVLLTDIRRETAEDKTLQKLTKIIQKGDWAKFRKDLDVAEYYGIKDELYTYDDIVFRLNRILMPEKLQRKVIEAAHQLGHFGMTKTKQMLREKYWFPAMNRMVEDIIGQCYECQVTTKLHKHEPIKMSVIPEKPWDQLAVDFGGPYPDGHYNLVVIDKRTRYPEVEKTYSTAFKPTKTILKKMFATHGTPSIIQSDNGPPFNSKDFENFSKEEGFQHHLVTPTHPRANGEVESFMKMLNKTEQISHLQGKDSTTMIQDMLIGYRSTPHPATNVSPYEALMKRHVRTKLDHTSGLHGKEVKNLDQEMDSHDEMYKMKIKQNAENRNTKTHNFVIGDYLLLKQKKRNKWSTAYEPAFYVVYRIDGSSIAARRVTDGREVYRDASQFKLVNNVVQNMDFEAVDPDQWREDLLMKTKPKTDDIYGFEQQEQADQQQNQEPPEIPNVHLNQQQQRPQRIRRKPNYLNDYIM